MDLETNRKISLSKGYLIAEISTRTYSTILAAYWDQPAPSFFNGSEDTPEYDRRKNVSLVICHGADHLTVDRPGRFMTRIPCARSCSRLSSQSA